MRVSQRKKSHNSNGVMIVTDLLEEYPNQLALLRMASNIVYFETRNSDVRVKHACLSHHS